MYADQPETLKVYELEPQLKHPAIFDLFDRLPPGRSFIIENDHDPIPLFYQLKSERAESLGAFEYLQHGPEIWKVEISKSGPVAGQSNSCSIHLNTGTPSKDSENSNSANRASFNSGKMNTLDVTKLAPSLKHPTVFEWFDKMGSGESFVLKNDHDPKPLFYQMMGILGPVFNWNYLEEGPDWWNVIIQKKPQEDITVGALAASDLRKAEAMKRMGVDFCCGGNKTISQAAKEANISVAEFEKALTAAADITTSTRLDFSKWDAAFLADYICNQHHQYFYDNKDLITQLSEKVMKVHGNAHPELVATHQLITDLFTELMVHFVKEEEELFPYIRQLSEYKRKGKKPLIDISLARGPLAVMRSEHENAGELLRTIRSHTSDYRLPTDACGSYHRLYTALEELEHDLHQHIHLENNILFVKALELEREFAA